MRRRGRCKSRASLPFMFQSSSDLLYSVKASFVIILQTLLQAFILVNVFGFGPSLTAFVFLSLGSRPKSTRNQYKHCDSVDEIPQPLFESLAENTGQTHDILGFLRVTCGCLWFPWNLLLSFFNSEVVWIVVSHVFQQQRLLWIPE